MNTYVMNKKFPNYYVMQTNRKIIVIIPNKLSSKNFSIFLMKFYIFYLITNLFNLVYYFFYTF